MDKTVKQKWLNTLRDNDGNGFGQVSNLDGSTDKPSYCALGILMDMARSEQPKYTFCQRIRNSVSDFRFWLASKILGYDVRNDYYYDY